MKVSKTKFVVVTIGIMMIFLNYYILAVDIVQLSPGWEYRAGITTVILIVYSLISMHPRHFLSYLVSICSIYRV